MRVAIRLSNQRHVPVLDVRGLIRGEMAEILAGGTQACVTLGKFRIGRLPGTRLCAIAISGMFGNMVARESAVLG